MAAARHWRGWRGLGAFWIVVLAALGGGAAVLEHLGAPREPAAAVSDAPEGMRVPAAAPTAAEGGGRGEVPPPPGLQTVAASAVPPRPAAAVPAAPEPPPLATDPARPAAAPDRPIPPPDPALLEASRQGALPRVGSDGRTSIRTYARAFDRADTRPRVAVVVAGIGLSASQTEEALRRLPPAVGLALNPYAPRLEAVAERARERGMETLISLPMEPTGYPLNDPGPKALLTGLSMAENWERLDWALTRAQGYVGVLGALGGMRGERFANMGEMLGLVQDVLRTRGLLYVEPRPGGPSPARAWGRAVDVVLDEPATRGEIERRLAELERVARERGSALGLAGDPAPVLVDRLAAWAAGLPERGLVLAPVTAVLRRPEGPAAPPGAATAASSGGAGAEPVSARSSPPGRR